MDELYGNTQQASNSSKDSKNNSGCYIATVVYVSYDCPQVWTLRRFRDLYLAEKWYGKVFINFYYVASPKIVRFFGTTDWFHNYLRKRLDKFVSELKEQGYGDEPYYDR